MLVVKIKHNWVLVSSNRAKTLPDLTLTPGFGEEQKFQEYEITSLCGSSTKLRGSQNCQMFNCPPSGIKNQYSTKTHISNRTIFADFSHFFSDHSQFLEIYLENSRANNPTNDESYLKYFLTNTCFSRYNFFYNVQGWGVDLHQSNALSAGLFLDIFPRGCRPYMLSANWAWLPPLPYDTVRKFSSSASRIRKMEKICRKKRQIL